MKSIRLRAACVLAVAAAALSSTDASATVTFARSFTAHFSSGPYATQQGSFIFTANDDLTNPMLQALSLSYGSNSFDTTNSGIFSYAPSNPGAFVIGAYPNGVTAVQNGNSDFYITFYSYTNNFGNMVYTYPGSSENYSTYDIQFSDYVAPVAVPEPAAWAMMLAGFGAIGVALRRDGRKSPLIA